MRPVVVSCAWRSLRRVTWRQRSFRHASTGSSLLIGLSPWRLATVSSPARSAPTCPTCGCSKRSGGRVC